MLRVVLIGFALLLIGAGAHRTLRWMDGRGWIFYQSTAPPGTLSRAMMELEVFHHPEIEHAIEAQLETGVEERESGQGHDERPDVVEPGDV